MKKAEALVLPGDGNRKSGPAALPHHRGGNLRHDAGCFRSLLRGTARHGGAFCEQGNGSRRKTVGKQEKAVTFGMAAAIPIQLQPAKLLFGIR